MITCPNCNRENAENFNFCLDCGYDLKSFRESRAATPSAASPNPTLATESMSVEEIHKAQTRPPTPPVASAVTAPAQPAMPAPVSTPMPAPSLPAPPPPTKTAAPAPAPVPVPASSAPLSPPTVASGGVAATCPSCGTPNPSGNRFCGGCGTRLDGAQPATPSAADGGGRTMFMHAADLKSAVVEKLCKLVCIDPSGQEGMTFTLKSGETVCGRVDGIILLDDPFVSPTHCAFSFHDAQLTVIDRHSLNGVYRRLVGEHVLQDGDHLRVGRQLFRFELMESAKAQVARAAGDDSKIWGSPNPGAFGRLVQILEDGRTGEIRLLFGDQCNLGREQGQIVFPTDGFISGRHCSFYVANKEPRVKDLGSSNGTYVRVRGSATINHGEFVLVGNQMLRVEIV